MLLYAALLTLPKFSILRFFTLYIYIIYLHSHLPLSTVRKIKNSLMRRIFDVSIDDKKMIELSECITMKPDSVID